MRVVLTILKDGLFVVSAGGNMMQRAGHVQAKWSGHPRTGSKDRTD
jgi:hypothetical protein